MTKRTIIMTGLAAITLTGWIAPRGRAECPLDHYFLGQDDEQLFVEKDRIYRHGNPAEGYYPLTWSPIYGCWSFGEPGFSDTSDPAYGFPPETMLSGVPNVDYQIWFEIVDISPDFYVQTDDGTWLTEIGDTYNLSDWPEHHVHMRYRAYVPQNPPPDYPFYVTYRLIDEIGPYGSTPPFAVVFNVPTSTVEETDPVYRDILSSLTEAEITFTFHRAIAVIGGPPATITDEVTHTHDYYTGYFDYVISPDGLTLTLTQIAGTLPNETWLEIALTDYTRDAVTDFPAVPFTHFVYTLYLPGDFDGDQDVDSDDYAEFVACFTGPDAGPIEPECAPGDFDEDDDIDCDDWVAFKSYWTGPPTNPPRLLRCNQQHTGAVIIGPQQPPTKSAEPLPLP